MKKQWKAVCWGILLCVVAVLAYRNMTEQEKPPGRLIREELVLPQIKGQYKLLFITDSHVVVKTNPKSKNNISTQFAGLSRERYPQFVDEKGTDSRENFEEWIEYANETEADGVLLGGDIVDSPSGEHMRFLRDSLKILQMPYVYTLGNHDWTTPWDYMSERDKQNFLPGFREFMQGDTAIHSHDFGEFIVAAVDNSTGQVDGEAIEPYKKILEQGKPVIVLVHVPFLTQSVLTKAKQVWKNGVVIGGGNYGGLYPNENSKKFMELTTAKDSPVVAVLAGHVHFYDRDFIEGAQKVLHIVGNAGFHARAISLTP